MKTVGVVWTLYIFYWIKVFLKLFLVVSFSDLYIYIFMLIVSQVFFFFLPYRFHKGK